MTPHALRLAVLLSPLLLAGGCGTFGHQGTARLLQSRLQDQLAPDINAGTVALQTLPDGARVTLLGTSPFPDGKKAQDDKHRDLRASVIEALLDPSLMRIQLADTSALPEAQRDLRVQNVAQYFGAYGLGSTLQPAVPSQAMPPGLAGTAPAGMTITITVQCPGRYHGAGYGSGISMPVCD
jgi:hypothetical protein